jgi:TRAP-type C4-dicarboxylate transport system permease small subunit
MQSGAHVSESRSRLIVLQAALARAADALVAMTYGLACLFLIFLVVVLSLQVLFRYVLQAPLAWSEEAARFALVWLSMTAACLAAHAGDHFVFRWATLVLPANGRFWLRRLVDLVVVAALALIFFESIRYLGVVAGKTAAGTGVNMRIPYLAITYGSGALALIYLAGFADGVFSCWTGRVYSLREERESDIASMFSPPTVTDTAEQEYQA